MNLLETGSSSVNTRVSKTFGSGSLRITSRTRSTWRTSSSSSTGSSSWRRASGWKTSGSWSGTTSKVEASGDQSFNSQQKSKVTNDRLGWESCYKHYSADMMCLHFYPWTYFISSLAASARCWGRNIRIDDGLVVQTFSKNIKIDVGLDCTDIS